MASRGVWRTCIRAIKQRSVVVFLHHESDERGLFTVERISRYNQYPSQQQQQQVKDETQTPSADK